jgi:phosphate:Na+ symporter
VLQGIVLLATGIVLFLFGMMKLSAKMQLLFTARIRAYIKYAVRKPVYGLLTGVASTIALQSSSATTVLIIGMVSAGLISFYHSLGMILGADIGTTLTVQLVVWKVTDLSPLFIIVGGTSGRPFFTSVSFFLVCISLVRQRRLYGTIRP